MSDKLKSIYVSIESSYRAYYLIAKIMFSRYVTVYEIFTDEIFMTLTLSFRMGQG